MAQKYGYSISSRASKQGVVVGGGCSNPNTCRDLNRGWRALELLMIYRIF